MRKKRPPFVALFFALVGADLLVNTIAGILFLVGFAWWPAWCIALALFLWVVWRWRVNTPPLSYKCSNCDRSFAWIEASNSWQDLPSNQPLNDGRAKDGAPVS